MRFFLRSALACVALAACQTFHSDSEPAAPIGDAGTDAPTVDGGPPRPGCADGVLYVTPDGNDADDGCSPAKAKKSLGGAIARVKGESLTGHEIHVCAGTYTESVTLDVAVSLRGGYSCNKFERTATFGLTGFAADGQATGFDGVSLTQLMPSELSPFTLRIAGASVGSAVVIDGLTVTGPSKIAVSEEISNAAIAVADGAAPTIENCDVKGGAYSGNVVHGSIGIGVLTKAAPIIRASRVSGGHGQSPVYGSTAIDVVDASAQVSGSAIDGGDGTSAGIGAMGIHVLRPDRSFSLDGNHVWSSGTGTAVAGVGIYTLGAAGPIVTIHGNRLHPRAAHCSNGGCFLFGIIAESMTTNVEGNIVDLGTLDALGGAAANFNRFGVNLRALKNSRFVNNVIHGGVDNPTGTGNVNVALTLEARTNPPAPAEIGDTMLVAHNTLFPGGPRSGSAGAMVLSGIKNISVVDNLALIPQMAGSTVRGLVISCKETANAPIIASMRNNALVGDSALAQLDSCPSSTIFAADPFNAEPSFADKGGNVTVFSNCNGDATTCFQSASCGANCPGLVIPGWSPTTYGADLLFGAGLKLGASTTCLVTAGGASLDPATDLAGVARTTKASIGAYELDGVCP